MNILEVKNLKKIYTTRFGGGKVEALSNVNFTVAEGEYTAIMGESGSGKTTLLNILASLDKPTSGEVLLDGRDISKVRDSELASFRRDNLGFVFQDFNLLDTFTLEDNICLPLVLAGKKYPEMKKRLDGPRPAPRNRVPAEKIPLRSLRRSETARRRRESADNKSADYPRRRADRSARLPLERRASPPIRRDKRRRSDDTHGNALGRSREPRRTRPVHP